MRYTNRRFLTLRTIWNSLPFRVSQSTLVNQLVRIFLNRSKLIVTMRRGQPAPK